MQLRGMPLIEKLSRSSEWQGDCRVWLRAKSVGGYGQARYQGRFLVAHRAAYELFVGPIPEGLHIDHLCRNRACINPAHLEPVTCGENVRRGEAGINMRSKTHCPQGHAYQGQNLYVANDGSRRCRACRAKAGARHDEKRGGRAEYQRARALQKRTTREEPTP